MAHPDRPRRLTGPVFAATTNNDKAHVRRSGRCIVLGLRRHRAGQHRRRRLRLPARPISPWFRSLFYLSPDPEVMAAVPIGFQIHVIAAFALFAFWPFTRLVHAFSAPVGYLTRPYVVYRSRDPRPGTRGSRLGNGCGDKPRSVVTGWERG